MVGLFFIYCTRKKIEDDWLIVYTRDCCSNSGVFSYFVGSGYILSSEQDPNLVQWFHSNDHVDPSLIKYNLKVDMKIYIVG